MKRLTLLAVAGCVAVCLSACSAQKEAPSANQPADTQSQQSQQGTSAATPSQAAIAEQEAKEIALADAGVNEMDTTALHVRLDYDNGSQRYDVEFFTADKEYDYEIDAGTGTIISKDQDAEATWRGSGHDGTTPDTSNKADGFVVTQDEAAQIALDRVSGATMQDVHIHPDRENRHAMYEGSIRYNQMEYEFEIDAANGNILSWEQESIFD